MPRSDQRDLHKPTSSFCFFCADVTLLVNVL